MSQVSLLSVEVGQNPDYQGSKGDFSFQNPEKSSAFSDAMAQFSPSQVTDELDDNYKQSGNLESEAANSPSQHRGNANDENQTVSVDNTESMPTALSGTEEAIDSKEFKSNDTPSNTALGNSETRNKPAINAESFVNNIQNPSYSEVKVVSSIPVDATLTGESDDAVDLLKMLNGAQKLLKQDSVAQVAAVDKQTVKTQAEQSQVIKANATISSVNLAKVDESLAGSLGSNLGQRDKLQALNSYTATSIVSESDAKVQDNRGKLNYLDAWVDDDNVKAESRTKILTEGEVELKNNQENVSLKNVTSNLAQTDIDKDGVGVATPAAKALSKSDISDDLLTEKVNMNPVEKAQLVASQSVEEAAMQNQKIKHLVANNVAQTQVAGDVVDTDLSQGHSPARTTSAISVDKLSVSIASNVSELAGNIDEAKLAAQKLNVNNETAQTRIVNQSTASAIPANTNVNSESQTELAQKSANIAVDDNMLNADDISALKVDGEKQQAQPEKVASAFNQTLGAQLAKPMVSSAELAAQQEQSFESTINKITATTVQTQKNIIAMNTETIAIYRKDFTDAVKDKVMVMINQRIQQVEIQLDPPEMGNIHVRVNLQNEQAAVQFIVQNQQAKDALEQNMAKLRDMLAESGVDVGEANIEQRQANDQENNNFEQQDGREQNNALAQENNAESDTKTINVVKASSTGIDYYA